MKKLFLLVGLVVFLSPLFVNAKEKHDGYYENITKKDCKIYYQDGSTLDEIDRLQDGVILILNNKVKVEAPDQIFITVRNNGKIDGDKIYVKSMMTNFKGKISNGKITLKYNRDKKTKTPSWLEKRIKNCKFEFVKNETKKILNREEAIKKKEEEKSIAKAKEEERKQKEEKIITNSPPEEDKEYVVFCVGSEDIVYARKKSNECPSALKEISRDEFCSSISKDDRILNAEDDEGALSFNAIKFKKKYCDPPLPNDGMLTLDQLILEKKEEEEKLTIEPFSKPEF